MCCGVADSVGAGMTSIPSSFLFLSADGCRIHQHQFNVRRHREGASRLAPAVMAAVARVHDERLVRQDVLDAHACCIWPHYP